MHSIVLAINKGTDPIRIAELFDKLMKKLGYNHYVMQGGGEQDTLFHPLITLLIQAHPSPQLTIHPRFLLCHLFPPCFSCCLS